MTNEEAIKGLKNVSTMFTGYKPNEEMFEMAIKALETVSCIKEKCAYCPHCENCDVDDETLEIKALEQQACEDAISRKDMLAVLRQSHSLTQAWDGFEKLPSVTPKEKSESEHDHDVIKAYNDGQAYILDKIRAEVELLGKDYLGCPQPQVVCDDVIKIIDKYRGE